MLWNETFWGGFSNTVSATNYVWRFLLWCFGSLVSSLCKNYWDQVPCSTLCKAKWRLWLLRPKRQNLSLLKRSHFPIYKISFKNHCQSLIYNIVSEASARFYERTLSRAHAFTSALFYERTLLFCKMRLFWVIFKHCEYRLTAFFLSKRSNLIFSWNSDPRFK